MENKNNLLKILKLTLLASGLLLLGSSGYFFGKFNQAYKTCSVFQDEESKFSRVMFTICDKTTKAIDYVTYKLPEKYNTQTNKRFMINTLEVISEEVYPVLKYASLSVVFLIAGLMSLLFRFLLRNRA